MIDWHSHVLPFMDDGSQSVDESLQMLQILRDQGATSVIATPHFLANSESVDSFLERRESSYRSLLGAINDSHPRILCGAEVKYYPGIAKMDNIKSLTIEGTNILLLEMSMSKWTEYTFKELIELSGIRGLNIVLAHIERYLPVQGKEIFYRLRENGLFMQVNASVFENFAWRRKALALIDAGVVNFIGSDCHNLTSRAPNLSTAYNYISKKFGNEFLYQMAEFGESLLGLNQ